MRTGTSEINRHAILKDIQAGMSDSELMDRYKISYPTLQSVAKELLRLRPDNPKKIPDAEHADAALQDSTIWHIRGGPRHYTPFWISVYDEARREVGNIGDLSETGLSVEGAEARVNEIRTFLVLAEAFEGIDSFEFEAVCRWVKSEGTDGVNAAGFEITRISEDDLVELRKIIAMALKWENGEPNP